MGPGLLFVGAALFAATEQLLGAVLLGSLGIIVAAVRPYHGTIRGRVSLETVAVAIIGSYTLSVPLHQCRHQRRAAAAAHALNVQVAQRRQVQQLPRRRNGLDARLS